MCPYKTADLSEGEHWPARVKSGKFGVPVRVVRKVVSRCVYCAGEPVACTGGNMSESEGHVRGGSVEV